MGVLTAFARSQNTSLFDIFSDFPYSSIVSANSPAKDGAMPRYVTMADVAREAGVSLMTVSRVINDKGEVSTLTRQHVQEVIERLGYRPSNIARGLVTQRTGTLGLVVPDSANPFFSEVARGAENVAYAHGYNVFLCNTEESTEQELNVLKSLDEKRVDGLLLCSSRLDRKALHQALLQHPVTVLVNRWLEGDGVGAVLADDRLGGLIATRHLLQRGHRKIGFLAGPPNSHSGRFRAEGYHAAFEEAGVTCDVAWTEHCAPMVDGGQVAARRLLTAHPELTALFCFNDLVAVGALQACEELGLAVPDDVAIIGTDDIPLAALVRPALTTCRVSRYELGKQAMQLLLKRIEGCLEECQIVILKPELVIRESAP